VLKELENLAQDVELIKDVNDIIKKEIGAIAHLDSIAVVPDLPKTRSGKVMRRILRSLAKGDKITQDISTLEDPSIVSKIEQILT
jgi:acetyl-CoA synthetase